VTDTAPESAHPGPWTGAWQQADELAGTVSGGTDWASVGDSDRTAPLVLDVRTPEQFAASHIAGAVNVPQEELTQRLADVPRGRPVVTY